MVSYSHADVEYNTSIDDGGRGSGGWIDHSLFRSSYSFRNVNPRIISNNNEMIPFFSSSNNEGRFVDNETNEDDNDDHNTSQEFSIEDVGNYSPRGFFASQKQPSGKKKKNTIHNKFDFSGQTVLVEDDEYDDCQSRDSTHEELPDSDSDHVKSFEIDKEQKDSDSPLRLEVPWKRLTKTCSCRWLRSESQTHDWLMNSFIRLLVCFSLIATVVVVVSVLVKRNRNNVNVSIDANLGVPTISPAPPSYFPSVSLAPTKTLKPTINVSKTQPISPPPFVNDAAMYYMVINNSTDGGQALNSPGSSQHRAFLWLQSDRYSSKLSDERKLQRYRLMAFFYGSSNNETGWKKKAFWGEPSLECGWEYNQPGELRCDAESRVTEVTLLNNHLTGTLVPELGELMTLETLNLDNTGDPNIGLTGSIPSTFHHLEQLQLIRIIGNNFSFLPDALFSRWTNVRIINFSRNSIKGPIPRSVQTLTTLEQLNLGGNELTGNIPSPIGAALRNIRLLVLSRNRLSGTLPTELATLLELEWLRLNDNKLTGTFPNVSRLTKLRGLDLSNNNFSGRIPDSLGNLRQLEILNLRNAGFAGKLPLRLRNLSNLRTLDLSGNPGLYGSIPAEICNGWNAVSLLDKESRAIVDCIHVPCQPTLEVCCSCCTCAIP